MPQIYIVEPRNEDGSLNVKDPNRCFGTFSASGVSEDTIFKYYFRFHPCKCEDKRFCRCAASHEQVKEFFKTKGWIIREKNW